MSSVNVVCCIFLQTFQTHFLHTGKQCEPRSGSTLFATMTFKNNRQKKKQTTIVVIGALKVNAGKPMGEPYSDFKGLCKTAI